MLATLQGILVITGDKTSPCLMLAQISFHSIQTRRRTERQPPVSDGFWGLFPLHNGPGQPDRNKLQWTPTGKKHFFN